MKSYRQIIHRDSLALGFRGKSCSFEHRPYAERSPEAREAYDRLKVDLLKNGMRDPLIVHNGCVLIGMRRFEILRDSQEYFPCIVIVEPVGCWTGKEVRELLALRDELFGVNRFIG